MRHPKANDATAAYYQQKVQTEHYLAWLTELLAQHEAGPSDLHWGHVGDLNYVNEKLTEAIEFLRGEGR